MIGFLCFIEFLFDLQQIYRKNPVSAKKNIEFCEGKYYNLILQLNIKKPQF